MLHNFEDENERHFYKSLIVVEFESLRPLRSRRRGQIIEVECSRPQCPLQGEVLKE